MDANRSWRVFYVRHGQSVWNAEQAGMRKDGLTEAEIKTRGHDAQYTDSPLSTAGVMQALELRRLLFREWPVTHDRTAAPLDSLAGYLSCTRRRSCSPPVLLTSNLRRAITTLLLALRPVLETPTVVVPDVFVLPALQETCTYADCTPVTRWANGSLLSPLPHARKEVATATPEEVAAATRHEGAARVLRIEAAQLRASTPVDSPLERVWCSLHGAMIGVHELCDQQNAFLREAYSDRLKLSPHTQYDDQRRIPAGALGRCGHEPALCNSTAIAPVLAPFLDRVSDVLNAIIAPPSHQPERYAAQADTVVVTAHSRLLRELLFVFRTSQYTRLVNLDSERDSGSTMLYWDASNSEACLSLASEDFKLSNTGAVAFDLELCSPPACEQRRLVLKSCKLDAGGRVHPRNGGQAIYVHDAVQANNFFLTEILAVVISVALTSLSCFFSVGHWSQRHRPGHRSSAQQLYMYVS
ncbi:hypothetical protein AB1Y20_005394 [Prymnesium parvum]|uniref:Phosphoglycerate mutase (2,3-diphosphoglycerate-dependent) n=1 Tax=Prymnesium parvum TaxID=97485 RepID=A0AB34J5M4_PRYPA